MSYSIDLYRGDTDTQRSPIAFGTYVSLFPQLIAGPIVRYRDVNEQLESREHSVDKFASGVRRFTVGLAKKILLGDSLAALYAYFGTVYAVEPTVLTAWMLVLTYTLHIYFDFSGYSDMAIGLGRMLGFEFLENFNYPYLASSITDFWRRWHISLSSWFREYVYIPLGGNRKGAARLILNMAAVWFLTGFWHGAAWNFILWGVFYFVILVFEKVFLLRRLERTPVTRALGHLWALLLIGMGWMIFDHSNLSEAFAIIGGMFGAGTVGLSSPVVRYELIRALPLLLVSALAATPYPARLFTRLRERRPALSLLEPLLMGLALLLSVAYMVSGSFSPFLYYIF
jgi:alginate O-acetyltransferase complex protein AlgI